MQMLLMRVVKLSECAGLAWLTVEPLSEFRCLYKERAMGTLRTEGPQQMWTLTLLLAFSSNLASSSESMTADALQQPI